MLSILEYGNLLAPFINTAPIWLLVLSTTGILVTFAVLLNILRQILNFDSNEPPLVFHVLPWIGNTIEYGIDPYAFFFSCQARYGDVFTFVLLGKKTTVCLGIKGNDLILNGKLKDVNAEEIYSTLTTPVFGKGVVYDCPNSKLLEQKKFVKFGLSSSALRSHVELITAETRSFFSEAAPSKRFLGTNGSFNVPPTLAELTIYTASRSLQGKEVREKFDAGFAGLFHDLDGGFVPINFKLGWLPLPHNRKRDAAQRKMAEIYMEIIRQRRESGTVDSNAREKDMIWNLMNCSYKDGEPIPDREIAHMMIALLMGGHHSSSSTISWILLRLASRMDIQEDLLEEQRKVLGVDDDGLIRDFQYDDLKNLSLHAHVVKETLRLHAPVHSVMRVVKNPIRVTGTRYIIPTSNVLLASPGVTSRVGEHFPEPLLWEPHRWDALAGKYPGLSPRHLTEDLVEGKEDFGLGTTGKGATSPYLPFGAGRHRCIGEKFAYVQLQTILATVVRNFKFHHSGRKEEIIGTDYSSLFTGPLNPATVAWERRREPSEDIAKQG